MLSYVLRTWQYRTVGEKSDDLLRSHIDCCSSMPNLGAYLVERRQLNLICSPKNAKARNEVDSPTSKLLYQPFMHLAD